MEWKVLWHPEAVIEREAARPEREIGAIANVEEKLRVLGVQLQRPHMRDVNGPEATGLWELRPRGGRSRWRPIYCRIGRDTFVILAVAPEFEIDRRGYQRAVRNAQIRRTDIGEA